VITGDIGGTNANFGVVGIKGRRFEILFKKTLFTKSAKKFCDLVNEFVITSRLEGFKTSEACFGAAGPVTLGKGYQKVKMTNANLTIDTRELKARTPLGTIFLINDFQSISYAVNVLQKTDYITLNKGSPMRFGTRAVLGAGTGLGKNILYYHEGLKAYLPLASEGGHANLPVISDQEFELLKFIKRKKKLKHNVVYEDVLSGEGLQYIYKFLNSKKYKGVPKDLGAIKISKTKKSNPCSKKTFDWFIKFYARCARDFALNTLARGGLYIAGGIAAKNVDSFSRFYSEFIKHDTYSDILKKMPIHLITNYDISLIGAAYALKINNFI
jgi:glucokinase